jgi:hypothetical protein
MRWTKESCGSNRQRWRACEGGRARLLRASSATQKCWPDRVGQEANGGSARRGDGERSHKRRIVCEKATAHATDERTSRIERDITLDLRVRWMKIVCLQFIFLDVDGLGADEVVKACKDCYDILSISSLFCSNYLGMLDMICCNLLFLFFSPLIF